MFGIALLALTAFGLCLVLTPAVRWIALAAGIIDYPSQRKNHSEPVARIGGVAVCLSYILAFLVLLGAGLKSGDVVRSHMSLALQLAPAGAIIFLTGLLDDVFNLKPLQKLAGQILGGLAACAAGVRIAEVIGYPLGGVWSWVVTVLWLLLCTNAFNLIDGIDGLAAGLGLFATTTVMIAALSQGNIPLALAGAPLAGALLAFLRYNFNPASIFLGDSGSLSIGFLLGCFGIIWSHKSATVFGLAAPLMALAIPLFDTSFTVLRRYLGQRPIFGADRGHVHHLLLDRGMTPRAAVLLLYGAAAIAAVLSLLQNFFNHSFGLAIMVVFCFLGVTGVHFLRFAELEVVREALAQGAFRRILASRLQLRTFRKSLALAKTETAQWDAIRSYARDSGFAHVSLVVSNRVLEERLRPFSGDPAWKLDIAVSDSISLRLAADPGSADLDSVNLFVKTLRTELSDNNQLDGGGFKTALAAAGRQ
jgi:UDP-GlcNAc:undecaprenyl-phosphate/decaprenyl-phosphate GlcNAc-1-phosphate transferase